jgi:hypothetical protein
MPKFAARSILGIVVSFTLAGLAHGVTGAEMLESRDTCEASVIGA